MLSSSDGGRLLGYARVSTDDQDLSLQIDALEKNSITKSLIFMDKLSGARSDRPGLAKCLDALQCGDVLRSLAVRPTRPVNASSHHAG